MKSDLDARPVFLQKENSIKGHFFDMLFDSVTGKNIPVQSLG